MIYRLGYIYMDMEEDSKKYKVVDYDSFDDMALSDDVLKGIYAFGFEHPSAIQKKAIMPIIEGHEVVAQAQSGTGKTGTFTIAILQKIDPKLKKCQAVIVAPTRELADQIHSVVKSLGVKLDGLSIALCVGGTDIRESRDTITKGAQVIVGTPGRIIDMIIDRKSNPKDDIAKHLKLMIFDEADDLLSNKFQKQTAKLIGIASYKTQVCLFSATLSREIQTLIKRHIIKNPVMILVKSDELTLEGITQFYINVEKEQWKYDTLCDLYKELLVNQVIIYVNTKQKANRLQESLITDNYAVSVMHSDLSAGDRTRIMQEFRRGETKVLISTDLLARGIDIQQVSIVINYDLPSDNESYLHRIGRSGRFGRKGVAINFVTDTDYDHQRLKSIRGYYHTQIDEMPMNINEFL